MSAILGKKITNLVDAGALDGTELTEIVQGGISRKTTIQNIVNLADQTNEPNDSYTVAVLASATNLDTLQTLSISAASDEADNRLQEMIEVPDLPWAFIGQEPAVLSDLVISNYSSDVVISAGNIYLNADNDINKGIFIPSHAAIGVVTPDFGLGGSGYGIYLALGTGFGNTNNVYTNLFGQYSYLENSFNGIGNIYGHKLEITANGTTAGTFGEAIGIDLFVREDGTSTTVAGDKIQGISINAYSTGDNKTITNIIGMQSKVYTGSGMANAVFTNLIAGEFQVLQQGSGDFDVANAYGILIKNPEHTSPTGVLQNLYGIYIEDQSTALGFTNKYNIHSEGANSRNRFEGIVSAGSFKEVSSETVASTAPSAIGKLHYLNSDGVYRVSDAIAIHKTPCIGILTDKTGNIHFEGKISNTSWHFPNIGQQVYVSVSAGMPTQLPPSATGLFVQAIGVALGDKEMYFRPEWTIREIEI